VPGAGEQRVLSPVAVERLSRTSGHPRWLVEAAALGVEVTPLHYLRNLAEYGAAGQIRLLRSRAALVGAGAALAQAAEELSLRGVGRLTAFRVSDDDRALAAAERTVDAARNRNASSEVETAELALRGGNPAEALTDVSIVAACLDSAADEQLLQFACRMRRVPLVLCGVQGVRAQATTVLPGDAGVALVYKPDHPHLDAERAAEPADRTAGVVAGAWLAEEAVAVLLEQGPRLRGRLRYADLDTGEMIESEL
jgi:molybdopterin/thiamine biosynthesis adenylyltransferase